jgi:hypothetical protein
MAHLTVSFANFPHEQIGEINQAPSKSWNRILQLLFMYSLPPSKSLITFFKHPFNTRLDRVVKNIRQRRHHR